MIVLYLVTGLFDMQTATERAGVAQSVERILGKDKVTGSIPVTSSSFYSKPASWPRLARMVHMRGGARIVQRRVLQVR